MNMPDFGDSQERVSLVVRENSLRVYPACGVSVSLDLKVVLELLGAYDAAFSEEGFDFSLYESISLERC